MLNRVKLLRKNNRDCDSTFIFSFIFSLGRHSPQGWRRRDSHPPPPQFILLFHVPFLSRTNPFNVNIKCINLLHLVYSLSQSILSQSTNSEAFFLHFQFSWFIYSLSVCFLLPETFKSFMYLSSRNIRVDRAGCVSYSSASRFFL